MVLDRDDGPSHGEPRLSLRSLPELAESLRMARQAAGLTPADAAVHAGVDTSDIMALESGDARRLANRVETLRSLSAYADSLGLPGDDYVVAAVDMWPLTETTASRAPEVSAPVVSVSGAPAGGHSPVDGVGGSWLSDRTGVPDATITGVLAAVVPLGVYDTGRVPIVDTGETPAVGQSPPLFLKVTVVLLAVLVALGSVALAEHSHISSWYHSASATTARWYHEATGGGGSPSPTTHASHASHASSPTHGLPKVTIATAPGATSATITVAAPSFTVKVVAYGYPCWVQATDPSQHNPVFAQTLQSWQTHVFTVTSDLTIETASSSGRAYLYEGTKFIGYYFPSKVPFNLVLHSKP